MSTLLEQTAVAMLRHADYSEEPKTALIDAFRRMRRERNAAYSERDSAHRRADSAQDRIRELELEVIGLRNENAKLRGYNIKLGIACALVFVLYFVR